MLSGLDGRSTSATGRYLSIALYKVYVNAALTTRDVADSLQSIDFVACCETRLYSTQGNTAGVAIASCDMRIDYDTASMLVYAQL